MDNALTIRWYGLDVEGQTCLRCATTQQTLNDVILHLQPKLSVAGWNIVTEYVKLTADQIEMSNSCEINGIPIEGIIDLKIRMNPCHSCSELTGKDEFCRSVIYKGQTFNEIPYSALVDAILTVSHLKSVGPALFL